MSLGKSVEAETLRILEYVDPAQIARGAERRAIPLRQRGRTGNAVGFNSQLHPRGAHGMFAASGRAPAARAASAGPRTPEEIKAFQKKYALPPTGKLDAATRATIASPPPETVGQQASKAASEKAKEEATKGAESKAKREGKRKAEGKPPVGSKSRSSTAKAKASPAKAVSAQSWTGKLSLKEDLSMGAGMGKSESPSPAVSLLQAKLQALGYNVGGTGVDGRFGPATQVAIKVLQREYGLKPTGTVESQTLQLLETLTERSTKWQKQGIIETELISGERAGAIARAAAAAPFA